MEARNRVAPPIRHLIVTGGNGYIGRRVAAAAYARGHAVTVLSRSAAGLPPGVAHCPWTLGDGLPDACRPEEPAAIVHLAHDWRNPGRTEADEGGLNAAGTRTLVASCRARGIAHFVFVSSQSARADAANIYGRVKWGIEQALDRPNEVAARVGLVYGGPRQAMFGLLCKLTGLAPVLPMIDPWRPVQPIHVDEVAEGLLRLAERGGTGWHGLAAPDGVTFGDVLQILAREFHGKSLPILPVPLRLALLACDISARLPLFPTIDRERVLGLAGTRPMDCAAHLRALGLAIVPLSDGLRREPSSRKAILAEGRALLRYMLGTTPGSALLRRYARAIGGDGALAMSGLLRAAPRLLRLAEPLAVGTGLADRLALALALAEASPEGERALSSGGRAGRVLSLGVGLVIDAVLLPVRLVVGRLRSHRG